VNSYQSATFTPLNNQNQAPLLPPKMESLTLGGMEFQVNLLLLIITGKKTDE
jgi:hypothetical protein